LVIIGLTSQLYQNLNPHRQVTAFLRDFCSTLIAQLHPAGKQEEN